MQTNKNENKRRWWEKLWPIYVCHQCTNLSRCYRLNLKKIFFVCNGAMILNIAIAICGVQKYCYKNAVLCIHSACVMCMLFCHTIRYTIAFWLNLHFHFVHSRVSAREKNGSDSEFINFFSIKFNACVTAPIWIDAWIFFYSIVSPYGNSLVH